VFLHSAPLAISAVLLLYQLVAVATKRYFLTLTTCQEEKGALSVLEALAPQMKKSCLEAWLVAP
jgi:hypothetical protein